MTMKLLIFNCGPAVGILETMSTSLKKSPSIGEKVLTPEEQQEKVLPIQYASFFFLADNMFPFYIHKYLLYFV